MDKVAGTIQLLVREWKQSGWQTAISYIDCTWQKKTFKSVWLKTALVSVSWNSFSFYYKKDRKSWLSKSAYALIKKLQSVYIWQTNKYKAMTKRFQH